MKPSFKQAISLLLISISAMAGLSIWNFLQARHQALLIQERWVKRVSSRISAERLSDSGWVEDLRGLSRGEITRELVTHPDFIGAYWFDVRTHNFARWITPAYDDLLGAPDPRLVVAQLKAAEKNSTQLGPMLLLNNTLCNTVAEPIDGRHALVLIQAAPEIKRLLEEEAQWAHLRVYVYDPNLHPLFLHGAPLLMKSAIADILSRVQAGEESGVLRMRGTQMWLWLCSFHDAPIVDGIVILAEPTPWVYLPFVFFIVSLLCLLWLARLPLKATQFLRRAHEASELKQFALRVDQFVRGNSVVLNEPPYPFNELTPIVQSLRWLMPLWKKAEAFPKEFGLERKLLSLLIESLPEGILFFNAEGALQLGNELGKVFFSLQQEVGREYKMINGVQVPRGFLEIYTEPVFTNQQPNLGKEVEVGWADGKHLYRVWVEAVDVDEKVVGYIVVVRDITFRKQWDYMQEQVLSGITHDLRGPLSAIMGYLDLLRRQLKDGSPKAQEYVGLAREAGTRLTQMISDILDVVRFEQGKIDMEIQAISVDEIFDRLHNIFGVTAGQKNVSLNLEMEKSGIQVYGDPKLLERVLDNLVGNAIKFTPTGGRITVTARRDQERTIFSVSDTGRGIPKEAQSRIFDKFQQVRPGDRSGGYGLGLAVVKFIVDAHKGEIRVQSELDKGSTFTFWIPDQPVTAKADVA